MGTPARLAWYAAGVAVVFAGAFGAGGAVAPAARPAAAPAAPAGHDAHAGGTPDRAPQGPPAGLQISERGYTLVPAVTGLPPGDPVPFRFTVLGPDGRPVTRYDVEHDKKMHLIVASRDLGDFRHLHPELGADGTWSVPLALPRPGAYRVFADFAPQGGAGLTLGADLTAPGESAARPLPALSRTATVDAYTVTLEGELVPGRSSRLTLRVARDGRPVTDLQPYLGAFGHLVALRAGDLAYLHVHPEGEPGDGRTPAGPEITFAAEVPSAGEYRLFLDFRHAGTVRTAAFTARAGQAPPRPATPEATSKATPEAGPPADDHGDPGHGH
nr:DUF748 domain-containing protein [Sphaerisporangium rufum]